MDKRGIAAETKERYTEEAGSCTTLSCGSNLNYVELKNNGRLLDIGCGRGNEAIAAAKLMPGGRVTGIDITDAMIAKANENKIAEGIENIEFIMCDIENLTLPDDIYDYVISNCVINHAKDKLRAYSEIYRVLKNGGYFIISDPVTKNPLPIEIKNDPKEWSECFGGALTEEEYLESIKAAGFAKIEILKRREYLKKGYDFISLTIKAWKQ